MTPNSSRSASRAWRSGRSLSTLQSWSSILGNCFGDDRPRRRIALLVILAAVLPVGYGSNSPCLNSADVDTSVLWVRLGKARGEQNESACPKAADIGDDPTEGPGRAISRHATD